MCSNKIRYSSLIASQRAAITISDLNPKESNNNNVFFKLRKSNQGLYQQQACNINSNQQNILRIGTNTSTNLQQTYKALRNLSQNKSAKNILEQSTYKTQSKLGGTHQKQVLPSLVNISEGSNGRKQEQGRLLLVRKPNQELTSSLKSTNHNAHKIPNLPPVITDSNGASMSRSTYFSSLEQHHSDCKSIRKSMNELFLDQFESKLDQDSYNNSKNRLDNDAHNIARQERNFLEGHRVLPHHRAKMIDWMIQVLRVLDSSTDETFFLATSILDRFFQAKSIEGSFLDKEDLHIFGLTSIFIASKLEDAFPITMDQIVDEASHGKFESKDILKAEKVMCRALGFKFLQQTLIDKVSAQLLLIFEDDPRLKMQDSDQKELQKSVSFICKALCHDYIFSTLDLNDQATIVLMLIPRFHLQFLEKRGRDRKESSPSSSKGEMKRLLVQKQIRGIQMTINEFLTTTILHVEMVENLMSLIQNLTSANNQSGFQNLLRSYPQYKNISLNDYKLIKVKRVQKMHSDTTASSAESKIENDYV